MTLKLALVACLAFGVYAQTPPQVTAPQTPPQATAPPQVSADTMTLGFYISLLRREEVVEIQADRTEASGKDPAHKDRKWLQEQTGLTDQEWARVHPVLVHAISTTKAKQAEAEAAFNQARKDNGAAPTGPFTLTAAQKKAIGALNAERDQIVLDHVQQIAAALGPDRFQQFDNAVRQKVIGSSVKIIPLKK
jgi:hypothetical protein